MTLRVVLEYDEVIDSWAAYCPEMPGINSCGATQEEAAANFKEAAELFFEPSDFLVPEKSKVLQMVIQMPVRLTAKQIIFETDISVNGGVSEDKSHIQRKEKD